MSQSRDRSIIRGRVEDAERSEGAERSEVAERCGWSNIFCCFRTNRQRMYDEEKAQEEKPRSALLQQTEDLNERLNDLSHENQQLRSALEEKNKELRKRTRAMEKAHEQQLRLSQQKQRELNERLKQQSLENQQLRFHLDQKKLELDKWLNQLSHENQQLRSTLEQREEQVNERLNKLSHKKQQLRTALEEKDEDLKQSRKRSLDHRHQEDLNKRMRVMATAHEEQLRSAQEKEKDLNERLNQLSHEKQQLRSALEHTQEELKESLTQVNHLSEENHSLRCALEQTRDSRKVPSSCQRCEQQNQEHKQEMTEMETFYKDKLTEARSALKKKEEELRSFRDRVAANVVLSLKTENTENMNSPVNQSRLTEMYHQLRVCTWPSITFRASEEEARTLVQETFGAAAEHMKALRTSIRTVSGAKEPTSPEVEKFRQSALENLQLSLLHSSKQDVFKAVFPQFDGGLAEMQLASECYWLGCLMALHTPPLHPHWDKDSADPESWTVFPWTIRSDRRSINRV